MRYIYIFFVCVIIVLKIPYIGIYTKQITIGVVYSAWTLFMRIMRGRGSSHN